MSSIEYNALLLKISRKLGELNIRELVFLCREKLRDDNQPNIQDVLSLFKELEDQNYLGIDRLEHLKELLKAVREWALFKQVKKFETKRREYNELLDRICEVLDDSVDLARLINICRLERERDIRDVRTLLKELEGQDNLGIGRLDTLKEILKATEEEGLLQKVEEFEKRRDEEDEFERIRDQTAQIVASARSVGGRVIGVLNMKTICRVAAAGITLVSVQEMLSRWSTYDQLVTCFNACVLPAGTQLINIGQGCVCFTIRADSLTALTSFWDMYLDGTLRQRLHNFFVTDEVLKVAGMEENVEVIVTMDEKEYEKGCFDFLHEAEGKHPPRKWRRNSDSALFAALEEVEEGTLVKLKQLENTVHLQEERIKILEQEVENLPQLFHLETGVSSETRKHFADAGKPWEDMVGETESVTSSDSGISELEIHRESFGSDDHWPETGSRPATLFAVEPAGAVVEVDDIPKLEKFLSKPHIITVGGFDDYRPETGSRPATLSAVEPAGVVVEVDDIPKLEETVTTRHFDVRSGLFRRRKSKGKGRGQTGKGPPSAQATKVANAKAAEHDVKKLAFRLGSGLITAELTARQMQENGNLRPPKRPGYGTVGRPIKLRANFFRMNMSPRLSDLYHYDVEITPDRCPRMVKRDVVNEVVMKYRSTVFQGHVPAFDGEKNLYSRIKLPSPAELDVTLPGEDGGKDRVFKVNIQFAASVSIESLKKFLMGQQNGKSTKDAALALDIVMRQIPSNRFTPVGRSFFPFDGEGSKDLGEGCEVQFGFYQSVRPSQWKAMLVNIDVSAKGFYKCQDVLDFVCETLLLSPSQLEDSSFQINKGMLEEAVRGIRIQTTHESLIKRKYTVWGVSGLSADRLQFDVVDETSGCPTKTTVAAYFKNRYNIKLRYPHLPCLIAGRNRDHYLPMEVCTIVPCERRHLTEQQIENLIRSTARPAPERKQDIHYWAQDMIKTSQKYLKEEFQTSVDPEMVRVDGRVLAPPKIKLGPQDPALVPRDGSWDMRDKALHQGADINTWALACFTPSHRCNETQLRNFCRQMAAVSNKEGMKMAPEPVKVSYARSREVESLFSKWLIEYPGLQLIVAVLPGRNRQLYPEIKRVGDSVLGIPTQCVQLNNVQQARGQLCANISLKINAKLGGINHIVDPSVKSLVFREPSIIFGADMSQPSSYECGTPSIAAVVASMDANATKYQARVRAQRYEKGREAQEIINDLAVIVKELLIEFYKASGKLKPSKIIFYRNGVSEGQFDQVLAHEVRAIQEACMILEKEYRPRITFIVVQKRHHTRLFCENRIDETGKARNVPPGTTVDSGITHPFEFDFYLCSHFGIQGTSRPTHYHVLYDDNGFDADSLQQLTYQLCHVYARCTKSVSMPAPAYYAHLAAFRARVHVTNGGSSRDAGGVDLEKCSKAIQVSDKMKGVMYFT